MSKHSSGSGDRRLLALGKRISQIVENLAEGSLVGSSRPSVDEVTDAIRARNFRYHYFPECLFGEPAWDMLLALLQAEMEDREVTVTNLCEVAGTPGVVTTRWLSFLVSEGMVRRRSDAQDATSELIELEPKARAALRRYFNELSETR